MAANCDKTVVKSPSDNRQYRILHLANGLTAVLVHDPQISAGSLMPSENDSPKFDNNDDDSYEDDEEEDDEEKEAALSTNFLAENGRLPRVPVGAVVSIKKKTLQSRYNKRVEFEHIHFVQGIPQRRESYLTKLTAASSPLYCRVATDKFGISSIA
eukprot:Gb_06505 [translate_table: standard]